MENIVTTKNLTKRFGAKTAVDAVNMNIRKGDIYGFIGRNGAGKTTAMKMMLGMLFPTSGEIELFGSKNLDTQRARIGSLIESPGLYKNCSAFENLKRFSILYGGTDKEIKELLDFVGLGNVGKKKAGAFSLGMRQRLGIAIALLGNPELLILDEPINGLDPAGIKEIRDLILKINQEKNVTVLVSSHLLDELSRIVTKYGIINQGVLVEEVESEELNNRCKECLNIKTDKLRETKELILKKFPEASVEIKEERVVMYSGFEASDEIAKIIVNGGIRLFELSFIKGALEEYFIERIG